MCDTLCAVGRGRTLFAKNSDRPPTEAQLVETYEPRLPHGTLRVQYVTLDDAGAQAVLGSRPDWLWGFEHGVNESRVAIGNEKVYTVDDPYEAEPALIGMDLVRLALERSENAEDAVAILTSLLQRHGQGGVADAASGEPYFSSFLVADPRRAFVLETSGRTWAARSVASTAAISNRLTLGADWELASDDVGAGTDFDAYRAPDAPTGHADVRLAASRSCLASGPDALTPRALAAHMRHHGEHPWGEPGAAPDDVSPIPDHAMPDGTGVSICMHVRGYQNTTSSIVAELPEDPGEPLRAWVALGSPCASVYVPIFPPHAVPAELGRTESWKRFAALRDRAESADHELAAIRRVLAPVEAELWDEADAVAGDEGAQRRFAATAWRRVEAALHRLG